MPSGQAAIALVNLAMLSAGDHVLLPRNVYGPSRRLAGALLPRFGVVVEFYEPMVMEDLRAKLRPGVTTAGVVRESGVDHDGGAGRAGDCGGVAWGGGAGGDRQYVGGGGVVRRVRARLRQLRCRR